MAIGSSPFAKLKPGPGHTASEVEASQRARLRTAMVEQVAAGGYASVTVRGLARTAGVSTATLYRRFGTLEDCFSSTVEAATSQALQRAEAAARAGGQGEAALRAAIGEVARAAAEWPCTARLVLVESFAAGPARGAPAFRPQARFERLLASALAAAPGWTAVRSWMAQGIAAGIAHILRTQVLPGEASHRQVAEQTSDWVLSLGPACASASDGHRVVRPQGDPEWALFQRLLMSEPGDERGRILAATAGLAAREGYGALSVPRIRSAAGVSRRAFDAYFATVDSCFLAAIETLVQASFGAADSLPTRGVEERIRRSTRGLCVELARNPSLGRLVFVEILAPGLEGLRCRERIIAGTAAEICRTAGLGPSGRLAAEASAATLWEIVQSRLVADRRADLPRLAPTLARILNPRPTRARAKAGT